MTAPPQWPRNPVAQHDRPARHSLLDAHASPWALPTRAVCELATAGTLAARSALAPACDAGRLLGSELAAAATLFFDGSKAVEGLALGARDDAATSASALGAATCEQLTARAASAARKHA